MSMGKFGPTAFNFGHDFWAKNGFRIIEMFLTLMSITYLIFVIFFTRAKFLENKIYTEIYTVNFQFTH